MIQKIEDLEVIKRLDETHGGTTEIILGKYNKQILVCKCISKQYLKDSMSVQQVFNEKEALKYFQSTKTRGVSRLIHTFQDADKLYLVLELVRGLPLHKLLQMVGNFNQSFTFLIAVQIGFILQEIHKQGFIYRDIKASNFMINEQGKVTIVDFGHTKRIDGGKTFSICGTTHSMPPEIYKSEGYSYEFDYYGFGILIYEMLTGKAPYGYSNTNPNIIEDMKKGISEEKILELNSETARDLVKRLLEVPDLRLGVKGGFGEILQHDYFNVPEFLDAKDIYEQVSSIDPKDPNFEFYISQIVDFGLHEDKYQEILPEDPFYKFFG